MNITIYMDKVQKLFQSGNPSESQWVELRYAILYASENGNCPTIDALIDPRETGKEGE